MFFKRLNKDKSGRLPDQPASDSKAPGEIATEQKTGSSAFALAAGELRRTVDTKSLGFKTTAELKPIPGLIGQERAFKAIEFGLSMKSRDFNIFVIGPPASGKSTAVRAYLEKAAEGSASPPDWVYVNRFDDLRRPRALKLPSGRAQKLNSSLTAALVELSQSLPAAFSSEDYKARRRGIDEEFHAAQEDALQALFSRAAKQNIAVLRTPLGFGMAPMHEGRAVKADVFKQLPEAMRRDVETRISQLEIDLEAILASQPQAEKRRRDHLAALNEETSRHTVEAALDEVTKAFADLPKVAAFLGETAQDLIANAVLFQTPAAQDGAGLTATAGGAQDGRIRRYLINVMVSHEADKPRTPVIEAASPTTASLVGRAEVSPQARGAVTDLLMIRPGSLHKANGGTLMLDARSLVSQPAAWDSLKRVLKSGEIRLEPPAFDAAGVVALETVEPDAIPLDLKVILLGDREIYAQLEQTDPDFAHLFKVQADFDGTIARTEANITSYARLIASMVDLHDLKPVDASGVARLIDEATRFAEDREKLTVEVGRISDIVREADYWAGTHNRSKTTGEDVARAIEERGRRSDRVRGHMQEDVERGIVLVDTHGLKVGQINGLSLAQSGGFGFGRPSRITARVHLGQGRVTDIEREVKLGGPLHSKGVMILWGYLAGRFAQEVPLALAATLVFEQSYAAVEGDSASSAELFALLSALSETPLRQELAVTGSVNQYGEVQAIGGVNEKIEGFFDVCVARGLTGTQGVVIPEANRQHLMLRQDVVDAVTAGRFAVHAIKSIDDGMHLLTGIETGQRGTDGRFGAETVNGRIEAKLRTYAERARSFAPLKDGASGAS